MKIAIFVYLAMGVVLLLISASVPGAIGASILSTGLCIFGALCILQAFWFTINLVQGSTRSNFSRRQ